MPSCLGGKKCYTFLVHFLIKTVSTLNSAFICEICEKLSGRFIMLCSLINFYLNRSFDIEETNQYKKPKSQSGILFL